MAVIVERFLVYKTVGKLNSDLVEAAVQGRAPAEASESVQIKVIKAILDEQHLPADELERKAQAVGEVEFVKLEKYLPLLETTTTISPLLGLLGTLFGMIGTFQAIAAQKGQGNNDAILAGVGEALYATACGLTLAVICFVAYNAFSARQRTIINETEIAATRVINGITDRRRGA
jgi:biopolymer transport protein ExbB